MAKTKNTKRSAKTKKPVKKAKKEKLIGKIEHIFEKILVITTTLKNPLKVGDVVRIKGHTTDFVQAVDSIQIEHESVQKAKKGDGIGIKVKGIVRDNDKIFLADKKNTIALVPPRPGISIEPVIPKQAFSVQKNRPPAAKDSPEKPKFLSF